jgi:hypothetical protein
MEICAGVDPLTGDINLTFRPRYGLASHPQYFVNDEREIFYDMQETFVFNPFKLRWTHFAGYTPEGYGTLSQATSGQEMITFAAGAPWFHNSDGQTSFNNFYGVQTNDVLDVPLNFDDEKVKIFQNLVVETPGGSYFADRIYTEDKKLYSYIPLAYFQRKEQVLYGRFLANMGTYPNPNKPVPSLLIDGKRVFGKVAVVRLVGDPNNQSNYAELNYIEYRITGSERSKK